MLKNLKSLKDDMKDKGWTICSFLFSFKKIEYIVLVKRFVGREGRVCRYALVKMHFMKSRDLNDDLEVEANSRSLIIEAKKLREYFGIEYADNLGDIIKQFSNSLGMAIPTKVPESLSELEKTAMVSSLSKSDSEDPRKIYCIGVKRNPNGHKRSEFNSDKTKLLRKTLFDHFCTDENISFCFSMDKSKEKDDATILRNFSINAYNVDN